MKIELKVSNELTRKEIRDKVIHKFLEESPGTGRDVEFRYYVEQLTDGRKIYLKRPTRRFDFDFKIEAEQGGKPYVFTGEYEEIVEKDLCEKFSENPKAFKRFYGAIKSVHACETNLDKLVEDCKGLTFHSGMDVEFLLKLLKWLFILEDVYYWNYAGRNELMNYIGETFESKLLDH